MRNANALAVFQRMEKCYKKCARFIRSNKLEDCKKLSNFGNYSYYPKRNHLQNVIQDDFEPDRLVSLFFSTTSDYPLVYKSSQEKYKIYSIKVFDEVLEYLPLGKPPSNAIEINFYNSDFILYGEKIYD